MERLETAERRFKKALSNIEAEMARAAETRKEALRGLELAESMDRRCETAIKQLRDLIRQGESHG